MVKKYDSFIVVNKETRVENRYKSFVNLESVEDDGWNWRVYLLFAENGEYIIW